MSNKYFNSVSCLLNVFAAIEIQMRPEHHSQLIYLEVSFNVCILQIIHRCPFHLTNQLFNGVPRISFF